ncbi:excitatory amino acid transporter 3-like [Symphorus nematophorus]
MEDSRNAAGRHNDNKCLKYFIHNIFLYRSLIAVALGVAVGIIIKTNFDLSDHAKLYIELPGEMIMLPIRFITVPLIVSSVITGLILVLWFKPGAAYDVDTAGTEDEEKFYTVDILLDLVRNMFPPNLLRAGFQQYKSESLEFESFTVEPNSSLEANSTEVQLVVQLVDGANIMGLIVCSFVMGLSFKKIAERGEILVELFAILNEIYKHAVSWILFCLPVGVLFMTACHVIEVHDWDTIYRLGKLVVVVVIGLIIYGGVLPVLYVLLARRNPFTVIRGVFPALRSAALTSSSSATLPLTVQCCEERNKINHRISRLVLPIGVDVNRDGTTLYQVIVTVFIAQFMGIHLDLGQLITIGVTAAVSISVGAARIPGANSTLTTFFVLAEVGLLVKEAAILVVVEWVLDHCNTLVNVLGDCIGAALINQLSKKELAEMEEQERNRTRRCGGGTRTRPAHTHRAALIPCNNLQRTCTDPPPPSSGVSLDLF